MLWNDALLGTLRCRACDRVALGLREGAVVCGACGERHGEQAGLLDFALDAVAPARAEGGGARARWLRQRVWQRAVQWLSGHDWASEAGFMRRNLHAVDGPVVELGSGFGREARVLSLLVPPGRVVAVDLSAGALRNAAEASRGVDVRFLRADATRLPFTDTSLGAVNTFGLLHAGVDAEAVVREVARTLRPGGSFTGQTVLRPWGLGGQHTLTAAGFRELCGRVGLVRLTVSRSVGVVMFAARRA